MKKLVSILTLTLFAAVCTFGQQQLKQSRTQHSQLKVGDKAPDFSLPATVGGNQKLSDYAGKKNVVVAFFPAAFTAGCTSELTNYTKENTKFTDANTQVIAVSTDFIATLNHWAKELDATFPIASDHNRTVAKTYGILDENNGIALRTTFLVDMTGKIVEITEDRESIDISGTLASCNRLAGKK